MSSGPQHPGSTHAAPVVSVRGEATLEVEPEIAVLTLHVGARAQDGDKALAALTERTDAMRAVVSGFDAGIERVETGRLWVQPEFDDKKGERIRRYVASTDTQVTIVDFGVLGDLVRALGEIRLLSIDGPWWRLRPDSDVYRRARLAAARDARRRARDYAAAFGAEVTGLVEFADQGMSTSGLPGQTREAMPMAMMAGGARFAAQQPELVLDPVRQRVSGAIEARFTMSEPDLSEHLHGQEPRTVEQPTVGAAEPADDEAEPTTFA